MIISGWKRLSVIAGILWIGGVAFRIAQASDSVEVFAAAPQLTRQVIPLNIWFGEGKTVLKWGPHNAPELKSLEREMKKYPLVHVEIEGNSDQAGSVDANRTLSKRRAEALRDSLTQLFGIPPSRTQVHAAGETHLVVDHRDASSAQNGPVIVILYRLEPA